MSLYKQLAEIAQNMLDAGDYYYSAADSKISDCNIILNMIRKISPDLWPAGKEKAEQLSAELRKNLLAQFVQTDDNQEIAPALAEEMFKSLQWLSDRRMEGSFFKSISPKRMTVETFAGLVFSMPAMVSITNEYKNGCQPVMFAGEATGNYYKFNGAESTLQNIKKVLEYNMKIAFTSNGDEAIDSPSFLKELFKKRGINIPDNHYYSYSLHTEANDNRPTETAEKLKLLAKIAEDFHVEKEKLRFFDTKEGYEAATEAGFKGCLIRDLETMGPTNVALDFSCVMDELLTEFEQASGLSKPPRHS